MTEPPRATEAIQQQTPQELQQLVDAQIALFASDPQRAKLQSMRRTREVVEELERRLNEARRQSRNKEEIERISEALQIVQGNRQHEVAAYSMQLDIINVQRQALKTKDVSLPDRIPRNISAFFNQEIDNLQEKARSATDPLDVNQFEYAAEFLGDAQRYIADKKSDQLLALIAQLPDTATVFTENELDLITVVLEQAYIDLLIQMHTLPGGQVNGMALAQDVFNFAANHGYHKQLLLPPELLSEYLNNRQRREYQQQRGKYETPSQLELGQDDIHTLLTSDNPFSVMDDVLARIEESDDLATDQVARAYTQKMTLVINHVTSQTFRTQWEDSFYRRKTGMTAEEFVAELNRRVYARLNGHQMAVAIRKADFEAIRGQAGNLGSQGLFDLLRQKGAQIAFNRFEQRIEQKRLVPDPKNPGHLMKVRLVPTMIARLKEEIYEELKAHKGLYGFNNDGEVRAAVNIAYSAFVIAQREALHVAWAKSPYESRVERGTYPDQDKGYHPFLTDPEDYIAALFSVYSHRLERFYFLQNPQKKAILSQLFKWVGHDDQELGRRRLEDCLQLYDVLSSGWRTDTMLVQLKDIYENEYGKEAGEQIFNTLALGIRLKQKGKDHRWARQGAPRDSTRADLTKVWQDIARYRPQEILKVFAETVRYRTKIDPKTGLAVYTDPTGKEIYGEDLHRKYIDPDRPNVFVELIKNGLRLDHVIGDSGQPLIVTNYAELEKFVGSYFYAINDRLAMNKGMERGGDGKRMSKGLPAIDYQLGLDPFAYSDPETRKLVSAQKEIVEDVFRKLVPNNWKKVMDVYLDTMKRMTHFGQTGKTLQGDIIRARKDGINPIGELVDNKEYEWIYSNHVRFLDDVRLSELQDQKGGSISSISDVFSLKGSGTRDMLARAWGDTGSANHALQNLVTMLTTLNEEELMKNAKEFVDMIKDVEGAVESMTGAAYAVGSWMNAAKTKTPYWFLGLDVIPGSKTSLFQQYFGAAAPSKDPHELFKLKSAADQFMGSLEQFIPNEELRKDFIKYSGTADMVRGFFYLRTFLLLMLFFMLQEAMKEAQKADQAA